MISSVSLGVAGPRPQILLAPKPPVRFGMYLSDAHKLVEQGRQQEAVVGMVETLKKEASQRVPDFPKVQEVHAVLARAFQGLFLKDPTQDNCWKRMMHSAEAIRLAGVINRRDKLKPQGLDRYHCSGVTEAFSQKEMSDWFQREGLEYRV
jgi:hypothetical protein